MSGQLALGLEGMAVRCPMMRVGLPKIGGALVAHAKARGYPALVSANALAKRDRDGGFAGWRPAPQLDGLDVALDSAGFVAWVRYGGFAWTVQAYVALAKSRAWAWWAQMDACCEAEVAADAGMVRLRQAETIRLLYACEAEAQRQGVAPPVKVLQGRTPEDYIWHAAQVIDGTEQLVGVGSMCRRNLHGPDGLIAVVRALDGALPPGVKLHLFGVKSAGIAALAGHRRIESVDSMAWDFQARTEAHHAGKSCTIAHKCAVMDRWVTKQATASRSGRGVSFGPYTPGRVPVVPAGDVELAELIARGDEELLSAVIHRLRGAL